MSSVSDRLVSTDRVSHGEVLSATRLRIALAAADLGVWNVDPVAWRFAGDRRCRWFCGLPDAPDCSLDTLVAAAVDDDRERLRAAFRAALDPAGDGDFKVEYRVARREEPPRWVTLSGEVVRGQPDDPPCCLFTGVAEDITDAARLRDEQRQVQRELRALADAIPVKVWTTDAAGNRYDNQRVYDYFGIAGREVTFDDWTEHIHPDDRDGTLAAWQRACTENAPFEAEFRLRDRDGRYRWHRSAGEPVAGASGSVRRWYGSCIDIDDHKTAELLLDGRARDLEQRNADLERFASFVAHDLKAPLRIVNLYLDLFEDGPEEQDPRELLGKVRQNMQRMEDLIQSVLAYTRFDRENSLHLGWFDLGTICAQALVLLRPTLADARLRLDLEDLPRVFCDKVQFGQCLQNLVENAVRYAGSNPRIEITGTVEADGRHAVLTVADDGPGIPPEQREDIFQPFVRLAGDAEGNGLGLAIVKRIVELSSGRIWVDESPLGGAAFRIRLRARPASPSSQGAGPR